MSKSGKTGNKSVTVKQATLDLLRSFGIKKVFGNPGSTELPFLSDWPDDIDYVLALQEASAVGMADGYAQATRNAGFVNLHSAAGVGNALGNIYTAHRNQTPLVITAGQQARSIVPLQAFLFAERASEFPRPYVKYSVEPARPEDVPGGDRARLLHRDAAAMRADLRVDPGRRLGPCGSSRRSAQGQPRDRP
ncbi:thiamine pyrophosphate-dependent acetolactate synthase large subunit-like protein [Bradyrhizobium sp. LM6.10]